jgi:hypothetical protein
MCQPCESGVSVSNHNNYILNFCPDPASAIMIGIVYANPLGTSVRKQGT